MVTCTECGAAAGDGSFCQYCGAQLSEPGRALVCSQCGTRNPSDTNFCHSCGARMEAVVPTSVVSHSQLAAESTTHGRPGMGGRARLVSVRRDGSDGESFPIGASQMDIGR